MSDDTARRQVVALGALYGLVGVLHVAAGIALIAGVGVGLLPALVVAGFGVAQLVLVRGLWRFEGWGRAGALLLAVPGLLMLPLGTLLSLMTLRVLRSEPAQALFEASPDAKQALRDQVGPRWRTVALSWGIAILTLGSIFGGLRSLTPSLHSGVRASPQPVAMAPDTEPEPAPPAPATRAQAPEIEGFWSYRATDRQIVVVESLDDVPEAFRPTARPVQTVH